MNYFLVPYWLSGGFFNFFIRFWIERLFPGVSEKWHREIDFLQWVFDEGWLWRIQEYSWAYRAVRLELEAERERGRDWMAVLGEAWVEFREVVQRDLLVMDEEDGEEEWGARLGSLRGDVLG